MPEKGRRGPGVRSWREQLDRDESNRIVLIAAVLSALLVGAIGIGALGVESGIASALIVLGGVVGALAGRRWGEDALFAIRTLFGLF